MLPQIPKQDILKDRKDISSYNMHFHTDVSKTYEAAMIYEKKREWYDSKVKKRNMMFHPGNSAW